MIKSFLLASFVGLTLVGHEPAAPRDPATRTIIYDGVVTKVAPRVAAPRLATKVAPDMSPAADLWITTSDLKRATRFVIKPQGVCRDELCFPLPKDHQADFLAPEGALTWFNLSAFARMIKQPAAVDGKNDVWYFGPRPDQQNAYLTSLEAPNFSLPDLNGKLHSLKDFRGRKVLLVTWASW